MMEVVVLLAVAVLCIVSYALRLTGVLLITSLFGLVMTAVALDDPIPFTPWFQALLGLIMLMLMIKSVTERFR